jgi:NitT/TauT family transport system permease protein
VARVETPDASLVVQPRTDGGGLLRRVRHGSARAGLSLHYLVVPALIVLAWQLVPAWLGMNRLLMPRASQVFSAWYVWVFGTGGLYHGTWVTAALASTERVLTGFVLGSTIGIVLGILIGWFRIVSRLFDPTIQLLRPIPLTAWVPIAILWFGIRTTTALFLITLGVFYPVVVTTSHAVRMVDRPLVRAGLMLGFRGGSLLRRVVLPAALPAIFAGLRVALGFAWLTVVISEMLAVKSGLGYALWDAYYFGKTDLVMAAMLSVGLLGFLSDQIFRAVMHRTLRWTHGRTAQG